ncbi:molybdopterin molybdotransferase MoeA [Demequina aurantiaca]|uniref:molybdopterin molybdotransferase MoeA n=1 Tax=Demequina aurantiaca TaxID=676200 RepID=UPI003D332825
MRSVDDHVAAAVALVSTLPATELPLAEALGLVLAEPVTARVDSPPFDNSAMDGFAVLMADVDGATADTPVTLRVAGESVAGSESTPTVTPGTAVRIMTGAPLPSGADLVVPVEATSASFQMFEPVDADGAAVRIFSAPAGRTHIRRRGTDVVEGQVVMEAGVLLGPSQLAAAASVGAARLRVIPRPVVAILATGDELVAPGQALRAGQIYDSNSVVLAASVRRAGGTPLVLTRVGDTAQALHDALESVEADLIVTSGGVSAGVYDVVKGALAQRGVEFVQVAMQPGKPQGLGSVGSTPIACLPGNPVSSLVSFEVIVAPMLRVLRGLPPHRPRESVTVALGWTTPLARQQYMPVRFLADGTVVPATVGGSGSHLVASLALAEALAVVPAEVDAVAERDTVELIRFSG